MRILVTGANGFIGSHLVDFLKSKQLTVRSWIGTCDQSNVQIDAPHGETVSGDLTQLQVVDAAVEGCTTVIHLAGLSRFDARVPWAEYQRVNVQGTKVLLDACHRHGVRRFVYVSSIEAVGLSTNGQPLTEDSDPHPRNAYGRSKLATEFAVRQFQADYELNGCIVRLGATYGPWEQLIYRRMFKPISRGFYLRLGDGRALMEFSFVKNQVYGIWQAMKFGQSGEIYFLSDERPYEFCEVIEAIARNLEVHLRQVRIPTAVAWPLALGLEGLSKLLPYEPFYVKETGRPPFSRSTLHWAAKSTLYCDNSKAKRELAYAPPYTLDEGLAETIRWYRNAGWL